MHASKAHRVHSPLSPSNIGSGCITTLITHILVISRARISCLGTLDEAEYAPFSKERRMKFAKATKFHRKSGEPRFPASER